MKKTILLAMVCLGVSAQAIIVNGSFEDGIGGPGTGFVTKSDGNTDIDGWTVINNIDWIGGYWEASDGDRSLDLSGTSLGGVKQTLTTVVGQLYEVTFDIAGNPDGPPTVKDLRVSVDNTAGTFADYSFDVTGNSKASMGWESHSFLFVADSTATTLTFLNIGQDTAFGPALDNVAAEAVPEPLTMGLLAAGGALALRRRKK